MIKNWKLTCNLASPLCGNPPILDSILIYEMSLRLGAKHSKKLTRATKLKDIDDIPIPVAKKALSGIDVYRISNPILGVCYAEWSDHQAKRFDSCLISLFLNPEYRKSLLTASGPYKMRYVPVRVRLIKKISWFIRGDRKEINKIIKKIPSLGKYRHYGYGLINSWEWEEQENDYSIFAENKGQKILMKTVPTGKHLEGVKGFSKTFGGAFPPYWHPETFMEIAIPC
jgi:hypothetical protein